MGNIIIEIELNEDGTYTLYDVINDREYECNTVDQLLNYIERIIGD